MAGKDPGSPVTPKSPQSQKSPSKSPSKSPEGSRASPIGPINTSDLLPASHWENLAVPHEDNEDSAFGDGDSSTASVTSSILAYRTMNGRTYHAERGNAEYWASNDELQLDSMDLYAHLSHLAIGGCLHKAPLDKATLKKAIDIGTGTGIWAIDFADDYPDCEVIGTDISPIQPTWVPPNLRFEIEDCTQTWSFANNTFDYVHLRCLYGSIPNWDALFDEAYRVCKPGGWIESQDSTAFFESDDGSVTPTSAMAQWGKMFIEAGRRTGRTFEVVNDNLQVKAMERLHMEDLQVLDVKIPFGDWPEDPAAKELGQIALATIEADYEGYVTYVANLIQGWNETQVKIFCAHIRRELRSPKNHPYSRQRVVWARKPLKPSDS